VKWRQLTKTDVAPEEFYGQFLPRVVFGPSGCRRGRLDVEPRGPASPPIPQINIQETNSPAIARNGRPQHSRLLYKTLSGGESPARAAVLGPGDLDGAGGEVPAANPTEFLLLLGLLKTDLEKRPACSRFFSGQTPVQVPRRAICGFSCRCASWPGDFLKSHQTAALLGPAIALDPVGKISPAPYTFRSIRARPPTRSPNEGRRLIECDRVKRGDSQGEEMLRRGGQRPGSLRQAIELDPLAGQAGHGGGGERRSGLVPRATPAIWPPQVEDALQEYVDEAPLENSGGAAAPPPAPP